MIKIDAYSVIFHKGNSFRGNKKNKICNKIFHFMSYLHIFNDNLSLEFLIFINLHKQFINFVFIQNKNIL